MNYLDINVYNGVYCNGKGFPYNSSSAKEKL